MKIMLKDQKTKKTSYIRHSGQYKNNENMFGTISTTKDLTGC